MLLGLFQFYLFLLNLLAVEPVLDHDYLRELLDELDRCTAHFITALEVHLAIIEEEGQRLLIVLLQEA